MLILAFPNKSIKLGNLYGILMIMYMGKYVILHDMKNKGKYHTRFAMHLLQYRNAILIACNNHTTTNLLPASYLSYPNHEHLWSNEVKNKTRFIFLRSTYVLIKFFHFYVWKILPLIQLMKLSTAMTLKSSRRSCKMQWLAIYPPPPVTKIVFPGMIQTLLGWKYKFNDWLYWFHEFF